MCADISFQTVWERDTALHLYFRHLAQCRNMETTVLEFLLEEICAMKDIKKYGSVLWAGSKWVWIFLATLYSEHLTEDCVLQFISLISKWSNVITREKGSESNVHTRIFCSTQVTSNVIIQHQVYTVHSAVKLRVVEVTVVGNTTTWTIWKYHIFQYLTMKVFWKKKVLILHGCCTDSSNNTFIYTA